MIFHPWQIFHAATTDQYNRVFLQIMPFSGDVGDHLNLIGQTYLRDFSQGRVWFFRCRCIDTSTHAPALRIALECSCFGLFDLRVTSRSNKLLYRWHFLLLILSFKEQSRAAKPISQGAGSNYSTAYQFTKFFIKVTHFGKFSFDDAGSIK